MIVSIAMPTQEQMYVHTALCITHLVSHMVEQGAKYYPLPIINPQMATLASARITAVKEAQKLNSDYILFIDSDATFPHNTVDRLLARNKDIIGVNASKRNDEGILAISHNVLGKKLSRKTEGVVKVAFIGMHVTLIKMSVFDKIEKPWFYINFKKGTNDVKEEDFCFCYEARQAGYHIHCDMDLSKEIGHIGPKTWYI